MFSNPLDKCKEQSIDYAASSIISLCRELRRRQCQQQQQEQQGGEQQQRIRPLQIATHSRSSTLLVVLQRVLMASDEELDEDEHEESQTNNDKIPLIQRPILCGQSTPDNEGDLLARDLVSLLGSSTTTTGTTIPSATCVDNATLYDLIAMTNSGGTTTKHDDTDTDDYNHDHDDSIDLLLVGADCICRDAIVNKVGTKRIGTSCGCGCGCRH
jgi:hypothetical protein